MRHLLRPFRFIAVFLLILLFLAISAVHSVVVRDRWRQTRGKTRLMSLFAGWGLAVLGVELRLKGQPSAGKNHLIVCNHLSYLDILILSAWRPTCYVTSMEIRETPFLGDFCRWANCLFVERRNRDNQKAEVAELSEALSHGVNVTVFPEATSTNGEAVLRFRRPLYRAAIDSGVPVLPVCLNYRVIGDEPLNLGNRDRVFWYGDMGFAGHLWGVAGLGRVVVELTVMDSVNPRVAGQDENHLAETTHAMVSTEFQPCLS